MAGLSECRLAVKIRTQRAGGGLKKAKWKSQDCAKVQKKKQHFPSDSVLLIMPDERSKCHCCSQPEGLLTVEEGRYHSWLSLVRQFDSGLGQYQHNWVFDFLLTPRFP